MKPIRQAIPPDKGIEGVKTTCQSLKEWAKQHPNPTQPRRAADRPEGWKPRSQRP